MEQWIIIAGIGWVSIGLVCVKAICNINYNNDCKWDTYDTAVAISSFIVPPIALIAVLCADGKDCFRRFKSNIYWNAKEGQIMTKAGKCLYDKKVLSGRIRDSEIKIQVIEARNNRLKAEDDAIVAENKAIDKENMEYDKDRDVMKAQLQCSAKTKGKHKMVYSRTRLNEGQCGGLRDWGSPCYVFECSTCNLEITKSKAELTPTERESLKALKVL